MSGYSWINDAMRIQIRTKDFRLNLSVPAALVGGVVRVLPDRLFESLRAKTPEPYDGLFADGALAGAVHAGVDIPERRALRHDALTDRLVENGTQHPHIKRDGIAYNPSPLQPVVIPAYESFVQQ